jgi:Protein of unknown function (DUF2971)
MRKQIDHWLTDVTCGDSLLCRYMGPDGLVKTLKSWQLRLNTWNAMVDPRECMEWRTADVIEGVLRAVSPYTQGELEADFDRLLRGGARMGSLTEDRPPDPATAVPVLQDRGWARWAMWDSYAADRAGACLVFSKVDLLAEVEDVPVTGDTIRTWGSVCYVNAPISLSVSADVASSDELREVLNKVTDRRYVVRDLYTKKMAAWASECEYRITYLRVDLPPSELDEPIFVPMGESLKAIILGEKYPSTTPRDLVGALPGSVAPPEVLRCTWDHGIPFLELV